VQSAATHLSEASQMSASSIASEIAIDENLQGD
jgi:hypothetical protein